VIEAARGAGEAGATLIISTFADRPLEEIARAATQPIWHATYLMKDRGQTRAWLQRAEASGCEAICVPIDSPVVGARDREHRTYRFPRDPISFLDYPVNYWRFPTTWQDIDWIRSQTKLPLVLKGILDPEDAELGIRAGAAAIFVSNHGGRNLDTLPATLEVLPEVADKVARRVPILVDGGVRRGTDILKALALGASAVAIGRPYLHGLAAAGAAGVRGVVNILRNELEMAMATSGRPTIASIDRSVVQASPSGFPGR
jgi:4-hydroxymandelate oxidase